MMAPHRFILAATDLSPTGNNAVWRAAAMALQSGSQMGILHVVDPAGYRPLREWQLPAYQLDRQGAHALAQLHELAIAVAQRCGLTASIQVREGDIRQEVVDAARKADLLVLGRAPRRRIRDWLGGRTAERILRTTQRPVLVARGRVEGPYSRVVVPMDFSSATDTALRAARQWVPDVTLQLFHAVGPVGAARWREARLPAWMRQETDARADAQARARMHDHVARLGLDHREMVFAVGRGSGVRSIVQHARQQDAELMVLARAGRRSPVGAVRALAGARWLEAFRCDLLSIPRQAGAAVAPSPGAVVRPPMAAGSGRGRRTGGLRLPAGAGVSMQRDSRFNWPANA